MKNFYLGLLSILLGCSAVAAPKLDAPRKPKRTAVAPVPAPAVTTDDPVEVEYEKLLEEDDKAQKEADEWIRQADAFERAGATPSRAALSAKIRQRFDSVQKGYEDFLRRHPKHVRARIAYGSFFNDIGEEEQAVAQWDRARAMDPKNPAIWNNLANHYGHRGPVKKAFEYYAKAIEIDPEEPVYLQNLATTVYLFRRDAMEFYQLTESQVFDKALGLYEKALALDPTNFPLATDLAQSYYPIKPPRTEEALAAWQRALKLASDDIERQGVYVHLARIELNAGRFDDARRHLGLVTHDMYKTLKDRLVKNLAKKEAEAAAGSAAPKTGPAPTLAPAAPNTAP